VGVRYIKIMFVRNTYKRISPSQVQSFSFARTGGKTFKVLQRNSSARPWRFKD